MLTKSSRLIINVLKRRHFKQLALVIVADAAFFSVSNAKTASSIMIMVGFILILATIYNLCRLAISLLNFYGLSLGKRLALYMTGAIGVMLAMESIGELSLRDVAVLALLGVTAYFYLAYGRDKSAANS